VIEIIVVEVLMEDDIADLNNRRQAAHQQASG